VAAVTDAQQFDHRPGREAAGTGQFSGLKPWSNRTRRIDRLARPKVNACAPASAVSTASVRAR